jgi:hypothetical protein
MEWGRDNSIFINCTFPVGDNYYDYPCGLMIEITASRLGM